MNHSATRHDVASMRSNAAFPALDRSIGVAEASRQPGLPHQRVHLGNALIRRQGEPRRTIDPRPGDIAAALEEVAERRVPEQERKARVVAIALGPLDEAPMARDGGGRLSLLELDVPEVELGEVERPELPGPRFHLRHAPRRVPGRIPCPVA